MKPYMVIAVLAPLCGSSIPMGFDMGVLNLPQKFIRQWIQHCLLERYNKVLTANEEVILWTAVVSIFLVGAMIGALNCSRIADKIGRKRTFLLNHIICLTASSLFTLSVYINYMEVFVIARFLSGICGGISSSLVPIYFSEVFPNQLKGVSGVIHVTGLCLGILLSIVVGMDIVIGSETYWRFLSMITFVGSLGAILVHPFILETPSYIFLNINDVEKASITLQKLRRNTNDIEIELSQLKQLKNKSNSQQNNEDNWDLKRILKTPEMNRMILHVVILFGVQQLSGINGCWFYSSMIFMLAGLNTLQSNLAAIFAATANLIASGISVLIAKKYPRRKILLTCISGCASSLVIMAISLYFTKANVVIPYIAMASFIIFIIFFSIGLGGLPFILIVELIPEGPRSVFMSLGTTVLWTGNLIVSVSFPLLNYYLGSFSLLFFVAFLISGGIYLYIFLPETFSINQMKLGNPQIKNNYLGIVNFSSQPQSKETNETIHAFGMQN